MNIEAVNHVGIRVGDKSRSVAFYENLGFALLQDAGFEQGHPVIMKHASGVVLNLLGPANTPNCAAQDTTSAISNYELQITN